MFSSFEKLSRFQHSVLHFWLIFSTLQFCSEIFVIFILPFPSCFPFIEVCFAFILLNCCSGIFNYHLQISIRWGYLNLPTSYIEFSCSFYVDFNYVYVFILVCFLFQFYLHFFLKFSICILIFSLAGLIINTKSCAPLPLQGRSSLLISVVCFLFQGRPKAC